MTTRIICNDGLKYVGKYDERRSTEYHIFLKGHMTPIRKSNIQDMFLFTDKWYRVVGQTCAYDTHIHTGGLLWPTEFDRILYSNDI